MLNKDQVKQMQTTLQTRGFYEGQIDGLWGKQSQAGFNAAINAARNCQANLDPDSVNTVPAPAPNTASGYKFSLRSLNKLATVDQRLQKVIKRGLELSPADFMITEGKRSITRQKALLNEGKTRTMNSRHLDGSAVDIAVLDKDGKITWDFEAYRPVAAAIKKAAAELGVKVEWGGDWRTFKDGVHFQLAW